MQIHTLTHWSNTMFGFDYRYEVRPNNVIRIRPTAKTVLVLIASSIAPLVVLGVAGMFVKDPEPVTNNDPNTEN